jgi:2-dehydropantoate 2-reductase
LRYLVYGTGAVGGLIGVRLALSGNPVTFLVRPNLANEIQQRGLRIDGEGSGGWLRDPAIVTDVDSVLSNTPPDVILMAVKAYDCLKAAQSLVAATSHPPPTVCLLNGIGNEATIAAQIGGQNVIAATLTTAVQVVRPGVLRVERKRGLGLANDHPLVEQLAEELSHSGIHLRLYNDRDQMKWSKVLVNIISNASSAITGWPPDKIFSHSELYRLELEALRETVRVMRQKGIVPLNLPKVPVALLGWGIFLPSKLIQPILRYIVASGRGDKLPSLHYDIGRGQSEIHWLNGAIMREGAQVGIRTPANCLLTETMLDLVEGREQPMSFLNDPQRLIARAREARVPGIS